MKRRTSLPRLNIDASLQVSIDSKASTPLKIANRLNSLPEPISMMGLVARNKEAGAPVHQSSNESYEEFPYQNGPKEILPRLYLGSEENAKDLHILKELGITTVICVAKEVSCPWLTEETIEEEDNEISEPADVNCKGPLDTQRPTFDSFLHSATAAAPADSTEALPADAIQQTTSRSTLAVRPLLVRPTASTPNLQQRFRESPKDSDDCFVSSRQSSATLPFKRQLAPSHSGYLSRRFSLNRITGRPAITYTKLPWGHDEDDIAAHFRTYQICELIDRARQAGGKCLVHCQLGVSRSATLVIGYCMRQAALGDEEGLQNVKTMHDSYTFVRSKSQWVAPNIGLLVRIISRSTGPAGPLVDCSSPGSACTV